MVQDADVLIFAEDPGAANCLADLPGVLESYGITSQVFAEGLAVETLSGRSVDCRLCKASDINADDLLEAVNPRLLVVGTAENPDTMGLQLIAASKTAGIQSLALVDAHGNAEFRFKGRSHSPLTYLPDWLCVPLEKTRQVYIGLGCPPDRVLACGHPQWRHVKETVKDLEKIGRKTIRSKVFPDLPDNRQTVVFISEGCARLKPRNVEYFSDCTIPVKPGSIGRTEIVLDLFLDEVERFTPRPHLVLRIHPKDLVTDYANYRNRFDDISRHNSPLEVLFAADFIVGMTSSLMMEAVLMGKPTLAIAPRKDETVILPAIELGLTPWVGNAADLKTILPDFLTDGSAHCSASPFLEKQQDPLAQISKLIIQLLNKDTKR